MAKVKKSRVLLKGILVGPFIDLAVEAVILGRFVRYIHLLFVDGCYVRHIQPIDKASLPEHEFPAPSNSGYQSWSYMSKSWIFWDHSN